MTIPIKPKSDDEKAKEEIQILIGKVFGEGRPLAPDYFWNIISAMRGPDFPASGALKNLSTCRLRAIVMPHASQGTVATDPLSPAGIAFRNKLLAKDGYDHFAHHFMTAMISAQRLGYDVPQAELDFGVKE
jgi:hypothetical protein